MGEDSALQTHVYRSPNPQNRGMEVSDTPHGALLGYGPWSESGPAFGH